MSTPLEPQGMITARENLLPVFRAWLYASGAAQDSQTSLQASLEWLRACWQAGESSFPLFLVHDLGHLLLEGPQFRFASARHLAHWAPDERAIRLGYEDRVLGRWALEPAVTEAHVTLSGMDERHRTPALIHALIQALALPLSELEGLPQGNPALLRSAFDAPLKPEAFEDWPELLEDAWRTWGIKQLELFTDLLALRPLFDQEDLWEIKHFPRISGEAARLALRQIHAGISHIGPLEAGNVLALKRRSQEVRRDIDSTNAYPTGGFHEISQQGNLENLVRTELALLGEAADASGQFDLFDVRYAQQELLYYIRDESPLLDELRQLTWVIDGPARLRHKFPALPAQSLVLIESLACVLLADLQQVFGPAGTRLNLVWRKTSPADDTVIKEESALLETLLEADLAHRRLVISTQTGPLIDARDTVIVSPDPPPTRLREALWLTVWENLWWLGEEGFELRTGYGAMRGLADALLQRVV